MIDHNHFICHFIFGGHLLNIPTMMNKESVLRRRGVVIRILLFCF